MYAAPRAQSKLMMQMKTETRRGVPRLPDFYAMIGVIQLLSAFPNYGKVIAIPSAKASSFPLNQKETMLACAVIKL
jgi:hypothetical protein